MSDTLANTAGGVTRPLTYGEKVVGLNFNPSNDPEVQQMKATYAAIIDTLNDLRGKVGTSEAGRILSVAITAAQDAQMWAVKGLTWSD